MKAIYTLLILLIPFISLSQGFYICTGPYAYAYHSSEKCAKANCSEDVIETTCETALNNEDRREACERCGGWPKDKMYDKCTKSVFAKFPYDVSNYATSFYLSGINDSKVEGTAYLNIRNGYITSIKYDNQIVYFENENLFIIPKRDNCCNITHYTTHSLWNNQNCNNPHMKKTQQSLIEFARKFNIYPTNSNGISMFLTIY